MSLSVFIHANEKKWIKVKFPFKTTQREEIAHKSVPTISFFLFSPRKGKQDVLLSKPGCPAFYNERFIYKQLEELGNDIEKLKSEIRKKIKQFSNSNKKFDFQTKL